MASIRLNGVTKIFGGRAAVDDVTIDVPDGEFLVLLGPSGCGKSTLLRMLSGLETLTNGEVLLDGRRVDHLPPVQRNMAFVFQSYALYPHMTVRRNISFPLIMRRFRWWFHLPLIGSLMKRKIERSAEVADVVDRTAKVLALTEMLHRQPKTLSGGQRQRVALGRAMVREPAVFLMDEPLSNLDAKLRTHMRAELSRLHARVGGTFVYVTHDQVEAMTMGTRIALMKDGAVQQFGTPREIYDHPANTFVARFVGSPAMNLLRAGVHGRSVTMGAYRADLPRPHPQLPDSTNQTPRRVVLGIRPDAMRLAPAGAGGLRGRVVLVEHLGAESVITVRLSDPDVVHAEENQANEVLVSEPGYSDLHTDDEVDVEVGLASAILFDPESGDRLPDVAEAPRANAVAGARGDQR